MSKGLEALDDFVFEKGTLLEQSNNLEIVKKELKALEIIKRKGIDIHFLRNSETPKEYMIFNTFNRYEYLTQEEYDLLKEVLL